MATKQQQVNFISQIAPIIQRTAKELGYKVCSPIIAQAICESNWGLSGLSAKYHNYFGLKCGTAWKGPSINMQTKEEYSVGTLTTIKDNFRVYASMEDGVRGYFDFISTARYKALKACTTPAQYLETIKKAGYATASIYVQTNMNIINNYNLTKFDDYGILLSEDTKAMSVEVSELNPYHYQLNKVYTTTVRLNVRELPWSPNIVRVYEKGTRFTNKGMMWWDGNIWMITPSGWVCTGTPAKRYIE